MAQIIMYRYNFNVSLVRIFLKNQGLLINELYGFHSYGNLTSPVIIFQCRGYLDWNHINVFVTSEEKENVYGSWCETLTRVEKISKCIKFM